LSFGGGPSTSGFPEDIQTIDLLKRRVESFNAVPPQLLDRESQNLYDHNPNSITVSPGDSR
jgi:hypothetical protein